MAHRELRDLDRPRRLAHGRQDQPHGDRPARRPAAEAGEHRLDRLVEAQAAIGQELRRHAHLGVDDPIRRQVLRAFGGDSLDGVARLEDGDGVPEALQVLLERAAVGACGEPAAQLGGIGGRELLVADLGGQLDHRLRPQPAVEMVVQQHLRRATDDVTIAGAARLFHGRRSYLPPDSSAQPREITCERGQLAATPRPGLTVRSWVSAVAASFIWNRDGGAAAASLAISSGVSS